MAEPLVKLLLVDEQAVVRLGLAALFGAVPHFSVIAEARRCRPDVVVMGVRLPTVGDSFAPGIGRRLDGWAYRDLNVGAIIGLSPDLSAVCHPPQCNRPLRPGLPAGRDRAAEERSG
jgi:hypothetical protein